MRNIHGVFRKIYNFRGPEPRTDPGASIVIPQKCIITSPIEEEEELFDECAPGRIQATPERPNITRTPSAIATCVGRRERDAQPKRALGRCLKMLAHNVWRTGDVRGGARGRPPRQRLMSTPRVQRRTIRCIIHKRILIIQSGSPVYYPTLTHTQHSQLQSACTFSVRRSLPRGYYNYFQHGGRSHIPLVFT